MLALIIMNDPKNLYPKNIHRSKKNILAKLKPFSSKAKEYTSRSQYKEYLNESGVENNSKTDTFFELKLKVDDQKWKNVPVYLRSGKALSKNLVNIIITFKSKESCIYLNNNCLDYQNKIEIQVNPEEKISIKFWSKKRGLDYSLEEQNLKFSYAEDNQNFKNPYQKILFDCMAGDQTLFNTTEEIMIQWGLISKILKAWENIPLNIYKKGSKPEDIFKIK